jgi:hypothetical protein
MTLRDAGDPGHDLPGSAVTALEGVAFDECNLKGMQLTAMSEAFDGGDRTSLREYGERQARLHPFAVDQDCARTALA